MALDKVIYVDGVTVITAENLNDIQDAIIALENAPAQGLTEDMKQALLQLARKVAYIDDQGQTYYDDLYDALYPPKTVVLITAVFEQGSTVIYDDTALDDLKQYLTVTAKYDDNTTAILADSAYTLSGLLEAGTSTVTVAYNGLTTTFTVNVTARPTLSSISAVYTQSGTVYDTDTLDSLKADLVVTANYSDSSTQTVPAADYTLSGTLTVGTSTITVSYSGKTTTFNVTVTEGEPNLLYKIESYDFDGVSGSGINTGVKIIDTDKDFTVLIELNMPTAIGSSATSGSATHWRLFHVGENPGVNIGQYGSTGNTNFRWMDQYTQYSSFGNAVTGKVKFAIRHTSGAGNAKYNAKVNSGNMTTTNVNGTFTGVDSTANFGPYNNPYYFMKGTLVVGKIYNRTLTDSEINTFMAG